MTPKGISLLILSLSIFLLISTKFQLNKNIKNTEMFVTKKLSSKDNIVVNLRKSACSFI